MELEAMEENGLRQVSTLPPHLEGCKEGTPAPVYLQAPTLVVVAVEQEAKLCKAEPEALA
jgi:hypothetical protein